MLRVIRVLMWTLSMYIVTHLFAFAVLPWAVLIPYVDRERIPALKQWFVRGLFAIVGKWLNVSGYDNIRPDRTYVIISNYPSLYASFALIGVFPQAGIVAHAFLRRIPLLGQALHRAGTVFVQPGKAGQGRKALALALRERGDIPGVIILPEGARTPDGSIRPFRRGFVDILRQTSLDLLPVTQNGLYQLKPVKRLHLDPDAQPELIIHPAVSNAAARAMSDDQLLALAQSVIGGVYRP